MEKRVGGRLVKRMGPRKRVGQRRTQFPGRWSRGGLPVGGPPPLTRYDRSGAIDASRMAAHFRHISPFVRGFLIPGSTGDGWELSDTERRQVLGIALEQAPRLKLRLLIGALKANSLDAPAMIRDHF